MEYLLHLVVNYVVICHKICNMTDTKLDAYILGCKKEERERLQEWRHQSRGTRVRYGAVVRTRIEELWEDEEAQNRIGVRYIYGVITNEDDYDENSTLSSWCVDWAVAHLNLPCDNLPYNLCCGMDETKMEVLNYKNDELDVTCEYPLADFFERDCSGEWSLKVYVPKCEYCGGVEYDRMEQKDDLEDMIEDLRLDASTQNQKRFRMFRYWIRFKHGVLWRGERREIDECVRMLIVDSFPPDEGTRLSEE